MNLATRSMRRRTELMLQVVRERRMGKSVIARIEPSFGLFHSQVRWAKARQRRAHHRSAESRGMVGTRSLSSGCASRGPVGFCPPTTLNGGLMLTRRSRVIGEVDLEQTR